MDNEPLANVPKAPYFKYPMFKQLRASLKHQRTDNGIRELVGHGAYYHFADTINKLANMKINLCEKIWCYWVGGFQEMQIVLQKIPQEVYFPEGYCKVINK